MAEGTKISTVISKLLYTRLSYASSGWLGPCGLVTVNLLFYWKTTLFYAQFDYVALAQVTRFLFRLLKLMQELSPNNFQNFYSILSTSSTEAHLPILTSSEVNWEAETPGASRSNHPLRQSVGAMRGRQPGTPPLPIWYHQRLQSLWSHMGLPITTLSSPTSCQRQLCGEPAPLPHMALTRQHPPYFPSAI